MSVTGGPFRDRSSRRTRFPLGLVALALLALAAVIMPVVVMLPMREPDASTSTTSPAPPPPPPSPPAESPPIVARRPAATLPASAPATAAANGATADAPILERRRIQTGQVPTATNPGAPPAPRAAAPRESDLDRSPQARDRRLRQFGGNQQTEDAVEAGLGWLAAHQSNEGIWSRFQYIEKCPPGDQCPGVAVRRTEPALDPGLTGLCILSFLGAGYTDRAGPYQETVRRAVACLLARQQPDGGFDGDERDAGYNDSLATLALAELYGMTQDPALREPLQRAVRRLVHSQQPAGGWDYLPSPQAGRNDTSITAWAVQALHTAASVGIEVPRVALIRAALHFQRATEPDGRVWYADAGAGFSLNDKLAPTYRYGEALVAAGLVCTQLLGWRSDAIILRKQAALLLSDRPSAARAHGKDPTDSHNEYYWYYGTAAMFQRGGESWQRWNADLRDAILPLQVRERPGGARKHAYGSWQPFTSTWGQWGRIGSRVYTTAISVLTLEIYYRHTPQFLRDDLVLTADDWRAFFRETGGKQRRAAIDCVSNFRVEICEPVLVELLDDPETGNAFAAAVSLAEIDSPAGRTVIERAMPGLPDWEKSTAQQALLHLRELGKLPPATGSVRLFDAASGLATVDLPRAYVGMIVGVQHDGQEIATMRVVQRFTGRDLVLAEQVVAPRAAPAPGDSVLAQ